MLLQDKKSFCSRNWAPLKKPTGHSENFLQSISLGRWELLGMEPGWLQEAVLSRGLEGNFEFEIFQLFFPALQ